jgi:hypothetical protein
VRPNYKAEIEGKKRNSPENFQKLNIQWKKVPDSGFTEHATWWRARNLTRISKYADLARPEEVKEYIAYAKRENGFQLVNTIDGCSLYRKRK